jgi:uncharacterized membrane protein
MRPPLPLLHLVLFVLALSLLTVFVYVGALSIAFEKLGLSRGAVFVLLFGSLFGSSINLPLFSIRSQPPPVERTPGPLDAWYGLPGPFAGRTLIAVNVGGALVPLGFSSYLFFHQPITLLEVGGATAVIATISHLFSRPIPGLGIGMPIFVAPLSAALTAVIVAPDYSAPLAYISGTLGVLIGADLLRLNEIRNMAVPVASIGGAGTFDGIFMTGIVAVLLA